MSNNKFFIGLGATVPSTRVLKPPGGDCNDLFGLKSRQRAQIKCLKGTSSVIDYLLNQSDDRHLKKSVSRNSSASLMTSMDIPTAISTLSSPKNNDNLTNITDSTTYPVVDFAASTENLSSGVAKELSHLDIDSVRNNFDGLSLKDNSELSSESLKESLETTLQNCELSCLENKNYGNAKQTKKCGTTLNSSISTKTKLSSNNSYRSSKTSADSKMSENKEFEKKFIRNPITGALVEVKNWCKSNPVISRRNSMQEIKSKDCKSETRVGLRGVLNDPSNASRRMLIRRNPITGEGISADTRLSVTSHSRIRVIHPPGGISSGIY